MDNVRRLGILLAGLFLAIGLAVGGYFISQTLYNAKVALNTAEVKGLAEKRIKADKATWTIIFKIAGRSRSDIPYLYKQSEQNQNKIINLLKENGFVDSEINLGVIDYKLHEFRDHNQNLVEQKHQLNGSIDIETDKVELVAKIRAKVNKLMVEGISIENKKPKYLFTKLNEIKPDMLKEATKNAQIAANEFAKNAGAKVGKIRNARQGGFIIRDVGSNYGDTDKIDKDVRVVTTISFYLD